MKLNIGCGDRVIDGYIGVDAVKRKGATIIASADDIPVDTATVDEVMAIHLIEHIEQWRVLPTLIEWARLLKDGGKLVIEAPDIVKSCRNVVNKMSGRRHPDQLGMWGIFGDPRTEDVHMMHRWGWCFDTLAPICIEAGFRDLVERPTQFHSVGRDVRDFRLEARRVR